MRDPTTIITVRAQIISDLSDRAYRNLGHQIALAYEEISNLATQVRTLSPQATLVRGYAVVRDATNKVIRSVSQTTSGQNLKVRLAEGELLVISE